MVLLAVASFRLLVGRIPRLNFELRFDDASPGRDCHSTQVPIFALPVVVEAARWPLRPSTVLPVQPNLCDRCAEGDVPLGKVGLVTSRDATHEVLVRLDGLRASRYNQRVDDRFGNWLFDRIRCG